MSCGGNFFGINEQKITTPTTTSLLMIAKKKSSKHFVAKSSYPFPIFIGNGIIKDCSPEGNKRTLEVACEALLKSRFTRF